ncbi:MAG: site-specific DNA-methyltransferase [Ignavibacteria bacterium]|nr:site-specific DNA-methyltransferase [Ignavibacteria bacterium]
MDLNKVYLGDCIEVMKSFPDQTVDLVFADPPFNIGIRYDLHNDKMPYYEYYNWSEKWIKEAYRLLKTNGSIYVAIGDEFAAEINIILKKTGFYYRNWIIWYYTFGQNQRKKFSRAHTHILFFTKSNSNYIFNDKLIRIPSARQLKYNDKRAHPMGKVPDDVWFFPRVCGTFKERIAGHPCQMPEELLELIIKTSSNEGDLVLDPFGGTGTTAYVAKKLNRNFVTIEISKKYYQIILDRLQEKYAEKTTKRRIVSPNQNTLFG